MTAMIGDSLSRRVERILQPEAEPSFVMLKNSDASLSSKILDLLAQTGKAAAAPGSEAAKVGDGQVRKLHVVG